MSLGTLLPELMATLLLLGTTRSIPAATQRQLKQQQGASWCVLMHANIQAETTKPMTWHALMQQQRCSASASVVMMYSQPSI